MHLIELCLLHNIAENIAKKYRKKEKNEKRCRDGAPKSTQTREDLNIQSPIPYIFTVLRKDIQMDEALSTYLIDPPLFVYFLACHPTCIVLRLP